MEGMIDSSVQMMCSNIRRPSQEKRGVGGKARRTRPNGGFDFHDNGQLFNTALIHH